MKDAGKLSVNPMGSNHVQLQFRDYVKEGDVLSINLDPTSRRPRRQLLRPTRENGLGTAA